MENYSQMSLLEVATEILRNNEGKMKMEDLLNAVLASKGIEDLNNEYKTQLYLDITNSAKFVYMGEEEWDLKERQPLKEYDKDGSEFNSKDDFIDDENDTEAPNFEDEDDEENGDDFDDDYDDEDEDEEEDYDHTPVSDDDFEHDDSGNILERYNEDDDFDEDKYNDYMDDFEDMYDDN